LCWSGSCSFFEKKGKREREKGEGGRGRGRGRGRRREERRGVRVFYI